TPCDKQGHSQLHQCSEPHPLTKLRCCVIRNSFISLSYRFLGHSWTREVPEHACLLLPQSSRLYHGKGDVPGCPRRLWMPHPCRH
uniref:Uncharacterized protein n=1 Tax=Pavo cristatus TaxID=9049 RepID=A0A8C9FRC1_PAVCR